MKKEKDIFYPEKEDLDKAEKIALEKIEPYTVKICVGSGFLMIIMHIINALVC